MTPCRDKFRHPVVYSLREASAFMRQHDLDTGRDCPRIRFEFVEPMVRDDDWLDEDIVF